MRLIIFIFFPKAFVKMKAETQ